MDDNKKVDEIIDEEFEGESFAEMFEKSVTKQSGRLEPGQKVTGRVLKVSQEWIFIDTAQKGEGIIDRKEFLDLDGNVTVKEGDSISAYFLSSSRGEMRFSTKVGGGSSGSSQFEDAWQAGVPVEGLVEKEIKGGYEIKLGGTVRAFCPYSQMSLRRVENPESMIGTRLSFQITDYKENGRNIVVSRRNLLEDEQRRLRDEAQAGISVGMTVTGTITSLQDFGAFIDIGGLEGLIPISEIGWSRVKNVSDVLTVGQQVQAVIKVIDPEKQRISLSIKDTLGNPWDQAVLKYSEGSFHAGTVSKLMDFGAFVALGDGIEGLIHISKLGTGKRINHPREVLKEGEAVEVKVESVDKDARRISLALAGAARAADEEEATLAEFRRQSADAPKGMGTFAELFAAKKKNR